MAQQQPVRWGFKAGLNVADWRGQAVESASGLLDFTNGYANRSFREGFHAGAYAVIPLGARFTLEPTLLYSQKGTRVEGNFTSESLELLNARATITSKASYLDLPVLAKFYVTDGFFLFAGPQVSFLLSNQINTKASVFGFSLLNRDINATDRFRKVDVALTGGLGYRFENGFNLSAGYDYGLNTLDPGSNFNTYNRVVKISLGYEF